MERKISATDARSHFGALMGHVVEKQEPVVVERGGQPYVVVISVDEDERLTTARQGQADWRQLVSQARARVRADLGERRLRPPEEMLAEIREERDEQLASLH